MNLLHETHIKICFYGYTEKDIVFIGSLETAHSCTWEEFKRLADHDYDDGFGRQQVAKDLIILFKDNRYLYRCEYDGYEWWEITKITVIPKYQKPIKRLFVWQSDFYGNRLEEVNRIKGEDHNG